MSEKFSETPVCDDHPDQIAQALCRYHKKLMCVSCLVKKTKHTECSIIELREISSEQDTILYEGLLVRQIAIKKRRLIEEHEHKTIKLKNDLDNEVTYFHKKLKTRLNQMKTDCLRLIEKDADTVVAKHKHIKQQLETFERVIVENIRNLSAKSKFDLGGIQKKLQEINTELLDDFPDLDVDLDGKFTADKNLEDLLSKPGCTLGSVYLISQGHYAEIGNETELNAEGKTEVTDTEVNKDFVSHKQLTYLSSDEVSNEKPTVIYERRQTTDKAASMKDFSKKYKYIRNKEQYQKQCDKEENKTFRKSQDVNEARKQAGFFRGLLKKKINSEKQENDAMTKTDRKDKEDQTNTATQTSTRNISKDTYQATSLDALELNHPKDLINKTVSIGKMQQHFRSACKFSKLVYLESGYLGLLSRAHDSVVLTSIDGKFRAKKAILGLSDIVACGREHVATIKIVDTSLQVIKFKVSNTKLEPVGHFSVNANVSMVTGFDFDVASSKFAVSSPGKLVICKTCEIEKVAKYPIRETNETDEVVTVYDFSNDCLFLLDSQNRTLKCFSFAKTQFLWKNRLVSHYIPKNLCLYKDKLCITNGNSITVFNAKDGETILKRGTCDLLDGCDGICVFLGVVVFSSNSSDFDTSAKLAFIGM